MTDHPDTYVLSRDEWLTIDRVLCDASLALSTAGSKFERTNRKERHQAIRHAQTILSEVYERAAQRNDLDEAFAMIQHHIGQDDGGIAAMFACGNETCDNWAVATTEDRIDTLTSYLNLEERWASDE